MAIEGLGGFGVDRGATARAFAVLGAESEQTAAGLAAAALRVRWASPAARRCHGDTDELMRTLAAVATDCHDAARLMIEGSA